MLLGRPRRANEELGVADRRKTGPGGVFASDTRAERCRVDPDYSPRVAVLVDTATGWGRSIVRGVASYREGQSPWQIWVEPTGPGETHRPPASWQGDGIIARVTSVAMARELRQYNVPIVNVSGIHLPGSPLPTVTNDLEAAARMAADYFLEWGFRSFGYVGWKSFPHVREHYESFAGVLGKAGHACPSFALGDGRLAASGWLKQQQDLALWLSRLAKPAAIFCWARQGRAILDACELARLNVPNQIAVLTGDDDELLYSVCSPKLSGIAQAGQQIGRLAAETLWRLICGETLGTVKLKVKPTHVAVRVSTDTLAAGDPEVAEAIRFIREKASDGIQIGDVADHVAMSRRSLERRFMQALGRSPADELRRVRLRRALMLLTTSSHSIPRIAEMSGFSSGIYLAQVVRQGTGMTPREYRSRNRVVGAADQ